MPEDFHTVAEKEKTKRHGMTMRAWVAVAGTAGLGVGGLGTFLLSPKGVTIEQIDALLEKKMDPVRTTAAEALKVAGAAQFDAARAQRDADWCKAKIDNDVRGLTDTTKEMGKDIGEIKTAVAVLVERTKKGTP